MKEYIKEINKIKQRLIRKAQKKGIWENFGQKEFRKLMDKYGANFYSDAELRIALLRFDTWAMNYRGICNEKK